MPPACADVEVLPAVLADAVYLRALLSLRPVILIDGGAGAGKSTLARNLAAAWPTDGLNPKPPEVVSMDEFYPGWHGLAAGSAALPAVISTGVFPTWDWSRNRHGPMRAINASRPLMIEGCGAITPESIGEAGREDTLAVWLEVDEPTRKARALARDGESFAPHWDEWADQEAAHWASDHPRDLADLVLPAP